MREGEKGERKEKQKENKTDRNNSQLRFDPWVRRLTKYEYYRVLGVLLRHYTHNHRSVFHTVLTPSLNSWTDPGVSVIHDPSINLGPKFKVSNIEQWIKDVIFRGDVSSHQEESVWNVCRPFCLFTQSAIVSHWDLVSLPVDTAPDPRPSSYPVPKGPFPSEFNSRLPIYPQTS